MWAVSGTYGAFTPLMYTPARLWSQTNQDNPFRGGVLHILVGHSGPETAADGRSHFGIKVVSLPCASFQLPDFAFESLFPLLQRLEDRGNRTILVGSLRKRQVFSGGSPRDAVAVLVKINIQLPMQRVLNAPMVS